MDEKKQEETGVTTSTTPETMSAGTEGLNSTQTTGGISNGLEVDDNTVVTSDEIVATGSSLSAFNFKVYAIAVAAILVISAGLMFILEKEGRISTGLFSGIISKMEASAPAAKVNGTVISVADFTSSLNQLTDLSVTQGEDVTDAAVIAQLRTQAIETLVNAELLRQAAVEEGITTTPEDIENRFIEIRDGIGGAEVLAERMAEFGVTEASLRKDIENEFLIQALFDTKIDRDSIEVSETDILVFYTRAGGEEAGLPPLEEVREQIVTQIRFEKEQALINDYLTTLRDAAEVEILI